MQACGLAFRALIFVQSAAALDAALGLQNNLQPDYRIQVCHPAGEEAAQQPEPDPNVLSLPYSTAAALLTVSQTAVMLAHPEDGTSMWSSVLAAAHAAVVPVVHVAVQPCSASSPHGSQATQQQQKAADAVAPDCRHTIRVDLDATDEHAARAIAQVLGVPDQALSYLAPHTLEALKLQRSRCKAARQRRPEAGSLPGDHPTSHLSALEGVSTASFLGLNSAPALSADKRGAVLLNGDLPVRAVSTPGLYMCHVALCNTTATTLEAPGCDPGTAVLLARALAANVHSHVSTVVLSHAQLQLPVPKAGSAHCGGCAARSGVHSDDQHVCGGLTLQGQDLSEADVAFLAELLRAPRFATQIAAVTLPRRPRLGAEHVGKLTSVLAALPHLRSASGYDLHDFSVLRGTVGSATFSAAHPFVPSGASVLGLAGGAALGSRLLALVASAQCGESTQALAVASDVGVQATRDCAITSLDLGGLPMGAAGSEAFFGTLVASAAWQQCSMRLTCLSLPGVGLGQHGCAALGRCLQSPTLRSLHSVDLPGNGIDDAAFKLLAPPLLICEGTATARGLRTLDLRRAPTQAQVAKQSRLLC